jgi:hypothetical protein
VQKKEGDFTSPLHEVGLHSPDGAMIDSLRKLSQGRGKGMSLKHEQIEILAFPSDEGVFIVADMFLSCVVRSGAIVFLLFLLCLWTLTVLAF